MERCPHCGTPGRPGAKFCTTCGYRIPNGDDAAPQDVIASEREVVDTSPDEEREASVLADWPASPPAAIADAGEGWGQPAPAPSGEVAPEVNVAGDADHFWPEQPADPWPAPPSASGSDPAANALATDTDNDAEGALDAERDDDAVPVAAGYQTRALRLVDELRAAIDGMEGGTPRDLHGVISDLEVAVTPPGAMASEEVAALREALLAARERPRDVDTIVDLTTRIEAMLSLIIAYDRAMAAIERSLEVLRTESDGVSG